MIVYETEDKQFIHHWLEYFDKSVSVWSQSFASLLEPQSGSRRFGSGSCGNHIVLEVRKPYLYYSMQYKVKVSIADLCWIIARLRVFRCTQIPAAWINEYLPYEFGGIGGWIKSESHVLLSARDGYGLITSITLLTEAVSIYCLKLISIWLTISCDDTLDCTIPFKVIIYLPDKRLSRIRTD